MTTQPNIFLGYCHAPNWISVTNTFFGVFYSIVMAFSSFFFKASRFLQEIKVTIRFQAQSLLKFVVVQFWVPKLFSNLEFPKVCRLFKSFDSVSETFRQCQLMGAGVRIFSFRVITFSHTVGKCRGSIFLCIQVPSILKGKNSHTKCFSCV